MQIQKVKGLWRKKSRCTGAVAAGLLLFFAVYPFAAQLLARVGIAVFNLFNHFNPRDVQNIEQSTRFGALFNNAWREYRGKFVWEF